MNRRKYLKAAAAVPAAAVLAQTGLARASGWPEREITLINGFAPGGATDLTSRAIAEVLGRKLGATIIVKNVPGGAGTLGPAQLAAAKPDGYTIGLIGSSSIVASPHLMNVPYRPWESFELIAQVAEFRYGLGVGADSPVRTLEDFIALGRSRQVTFASTSPTNLTSMYRLGKLTGANFRWIVFKGEVDSVAQAVGGHVDACLQSATGMIPQIEAGKLRLIASASDDRWTEYPDVKTIREHGFDAATRGPLGYAVPAGTDPAIRARLQNAIEASLADPELQQQFRNLGVVGKYRSGADFHALLKSMEPDIHEVLKENNLLKKS